MTKEQKSHLTYMQWPAQQFEHFTFNFLFQLKQHESLRAAVAPL